MNEISNLHVAKTGKFIISYMFNTKKLVPSEQRVKQRHIPTTQKTHVSTYIYIILNLYNRFKLIIQELYIGYRYKRLVYAVRHSFFIGIINTKD